MKGIKQDTFKDLVMRQLSLKNIRILTPRTGNNEMPQGLRAEIKYKGSMQFKDFLEKCFEYQEELGAPIGEVKLNNDIVISNEEMQEIYNGFKYLPINQRREKVFQSIILRIKDYEKQQHNDIEKNLKHIMEQWVYIFPQGDRYRKHLFDALDHVKKFKKDKISSECKEVINNISKEFKRIDAKKYYSMLLDKSLLTKIYNAPIG